MVTYADVEARSAKISVTGLGYVGLPIAVAFAKKADVIGFDVSASKIALYKEGKDPTKEVGEAGVAASSVHFTDDPRALRDALFHIVAVPTPVRKDKVPDLTPLEEASRTLGQNLVKGSIVVYESTVYPGVTQDVCVPILEKESGLTCGVDFKVGYSPERINPGDQEHRLHTIVKVVSGMDAQTLDTVAKVYEMVIDAGVYRAPSIRVAEAAKVIENSQRDINIAFMNELALIFNRMDIDTLEVLEAAGTKWNFLPFKPGLVGGHCIGVDPYYLTYCAEQTGYHSEVILAGRRINDNMGKYIAERTIKLLIQSGNAVKGAKVAILGLTFKENCPDTRNTRVIDIIDELKEYGIEAIVHDPVADAEEARAHYALHLAPKGAVRGMDALVVAVAHAEFDNYQWDGMLGENGVIVDVKGTVKPTGKHLYWRL